MAKVKLVFLQVCRLQKQIALADVVLKQNLAKVGGGLQTSYYRCLVLEIQIVDNYLILIYYIRQRGIDIDEDVAKFSFICFLRANCHKTT